MHHQLCEQSCLKLSSSNLCYNNNNKLGERLNRFRGGCNEFVWCLNLVYAKTTLTHISCVCDWLNASSSIYRAPYNLILWLYLRRSSNECHWDLRLMFKRHPDHLCVLLLLPPPPPPPLPLWLPLLPLLLLPLLPLLLQLQLKLQLLRRLTVLCLEEAPSFVALFFYH